MGFFSWLFKPSAGKAVANTTKRVSSQDAAEEIAALHREATAKKSEKDWDAAIACLREAAELSPHTKVTYPIKHYLRLPVFLQQAGRVDESMREFSELIDSVQGRIGKDFAHQPESVQEYLCHADYAAIYEAMATACKRQKMLEKMTEYAELATFHDNEHKRLSKKKHPKPRSYKRQH